MNESDVKAIFEACAQQADSPFWTDLFTDCAQGKFPKGVKRRSEMLYIKGVNSLPILINLSNKNVETLYQRIMQAFVDILHITCEADATQQRSRFDSHVMEKQTKFKERSWTDVKKADERKYCLQQFINTLVEQHRSQITIKITPKIYGQLFNELMFALTTKEIVNDQIKFGEGRIISIENVKFDPQKVSIIVEPFVEKKKKRRVTVQQAPAPDDLEDKEAEIPVLSQVSISAMWGKFHKNAELRRKSYIIQKA